MQFNLLIRCSVPKQKIWNDVIPVSLKIYFLCMIFTAGTSWAWSLVVGFTTTCAISAYHHKSCEFESHSCRGVLNTTLCDNVGQWLATGRWFSLSISVSSNNKTDHRDITEILLKMALNTIALNPYTYKPVICLQWYRLWGHKFQCT